MKYKVIDWETMDAKTLQRMLDEVYNEGFQDGYHKCKLEKQSTTTTPNYYYGHYDKTCEVTFSNNGCCCKY